MYLPIELWIIIIKECPTYSDSINLLLTCKTLSSLLNETCTNTMLNEMSTYKLNQLLKSGKKKKYIASCIVMDVCADDFMSPTMTVYLDGNKSYIHLINLKNYKIRRTDHYYYELPSIEFNSMELQLSVIPSGGCNMELIKQYLPVDHESFLSYTPQYIKKQFIRTETLYGAVCVNMYFCIEKIIFY